MSLTRCLKKLGVSKHEATIYKAVFADFREDGIEAKEAARRSVQERLDELLAERASVVKQILAKGGEVKGDADQVADAGKNVEAAGAQPAKPAETPTDHVAGAGKKVESEESVGESDSPAIAQPIGEPKETFAGQYNRGMTAFNARQQKARLDREQPSLAWKVEEAPQFGDDRFVVAGYEGIAPISDSEVAQAKTALPDLRADVGSALDATDKQTAATHYGAARWNQTVADRLLADYADWLHSAGKMAHALSALFKKIARAAAHGALAVATAFHLTTINVPEANAATIPITQAQVKRVFEAPKADFKGVEASADVKFVADWQVRQQHGEPFIVAEKPTGLMFAFDGDGKLLAKAPALYGKSVGDALLPSSESKTVDETTNAEKITPAGAFRGEVTQDYGKPSLTFERGAGWRIGIHTVYLGDPQENRADRLKSETGADNRVSYGCINAEAAFVDQVLVPHFSGGSRVIVLPETQQVEKFFPMVSNEIAETTETVTTGGGQTDGATSVSWGEGKYRNEDGRRGGRANATRRRERGSVDEAAPLASRAKPEYDSADANSFRDEAGRRGIPEAVRNDPRYREPAAAMRDVDATRALRRELETLEKETHAKITEEREALGIKASDPRVTLFGLDDDGNVVVMGGRLTAANAAAKFSDKHDLGVIVRLSAGLNSQSDLSALRDAGFMLEISNGAYSKSDSRNTIVASHNLRGIPMFSRSEPASRGMAVEAAQAYIAPILKKWKNAPPVRIVVSTDDLPIAAKIRELGAESEVRGWFDGKTVWLVASNIPSNRALLETLFHEAFGHYGLRGLLEESQLDPVLREVYLLNEGAIRKMVADEYGHLDLAQPAHRLMAAEEYLAHMAQAAATDPAYKKVFKALQRVYAMLRDFLRSIGVDLKLSDSDLQALVARSRRWVEAGLEDGVAHGAVSAFSRSPIPLWVSALAKRIEDVKGESLPSEQWKGAKPLAFSRKRVPDWIQGAALQSAAAKIDTYAPDKPIGDKVKELTNNWKERLVQGMVDSYAPLKRLDYDAYVAARMVKSADGVLEGLLMYGKPVLDKDGAVRGDLDGKGFLGAMQDLKGEHDRFFMWIAGNRAARLAGEGRENLFKPDEIAAMRTLNQGKMKDGSSREIAYAKASEVFRQYNKAVMDMAEKTGLIDGAARHLWEHDFYVPFYRVMEENDALAGPSQVKGLVRQKAFQSLKGGQENLGDLMENTLRNWSHLISASLANQAAAKSLQAAEKAGVALEASQETARQMGKATGNKKGVVYYMDHGKERYMLVDDPFVLEAITSMEAASFKGLPMRLMGAFKRALTIGVTAAPPFKLRNLMRDSLSAIGQNDMSFNVAKNLTEGWKLTDKKNADYAQMLFGGGLMRFGTSLEGSRGEHVKRLINAGVDDGTILNTPEKVKAALGKMWDSWQDFGDRMENINRSALYKQLIEKGVSHRDAAFQARDMMDFSLQGSWVGMRFLTQIVPFLNARAQGLYKLGRAGKQNPKRLGYVAGAVALASIALLLAYQDDDDWKKREDWDRDLFWWVKVGGVAFRIPKPFEIGAIGTIAERSVELMLSKEMTGKRFGERMRSMLMDTFGMNPIPQMFKPMVDLYANKDSFTGRAIEGAAMEHLSKAERMDNRTSVIAKALGNSFVSPAQIDFAIRAYFGWLGSHVAMTVDLMAQPFSDVKKPARNLGDMFVVGDFVKDLPAGQSRYVEQFYKQAKQSAEIMADIRHARQLGNFERAKEIATENPDAVRMSGVYSTGQRVMSKVGQEIQRLEASRTMTAEEKRARIDGLTKQRNELAKMVSERATASVAQP